MAYWLVRASIGMDALLFPWEAVGQDYLTFDSSGAKPFETRREARKAIQACDWADRIEIWDNERLKARLASHELAGDFDYEWSLQPGNWPPKPHSLTKPTATL